MLLYFILGEYTKSTNHKGKDIHFFALKLITLSKDALAKVKRQTQNGRRYLTWIGLTKKSSSMYVYKKQQISKKNKNRIRKQKQT